MSVVIVDDRDRLRAFFQHAPAVHVYELGDLDDRFWPDTRWHGLEDDHGELVAVALVYTASELPVVLALGGAPVAALLAQIAGELPARLCGHLSHGLAAALAPRFTVASRGDHLKLALVDPGRMRGIDTSRVTPLGPEDRDVLEAFYARCYPGSWFDPKLLDSGHYVGIRDPELVACGGVQVYSAAQRVAALGNIATAPERRGKRLATAIVARLCDQLAPTVDHIGLNVRADNRAALACYERLGFERVASYELLLLVARFFTPGYVERVQLRDGTQVRLRLIGPDDKALLRTGFERLSPASRYARFLVPKQQLSDDELRYLTEIDQEHHFAIGAVREAGEPVGLGIARFIRLDATTAEAAIAVADEIHGQGLGKLLFLRLVAAATERGISRFRLELLCSNAAMHELIRKVAPEHTIAVAGGVMTIELALPEVHPAQPHAMPPPESALYRVFQAAASNAVEWTEAVRRLWRR